MQKFILKYIFTLKKQNNKKGSATIQFKVERDRSPDRLNSEAQASATLDCWESPPDDI
jgi:hypothetical protein